MGGPPTPHDFPDPREQELQIRRIVDSKLSGLMELLSERDRRYEERFIAAALASQAALAATERAIDKSEKAQQLKNDALNEARGEIRDRAATLIERKEVESLVRELRALAGTNRDDIAKLREAQSGILVEQATIAKVESKDFDHGVASIMVAMAVLSLLGDVALALIIHFT